MNLDLAIGTHFSDIENVVVCPDNTVGHCVYTTDFLNFAVFISPKIPEILFNTSCSFIDTGKIGI